MDSMPQVMTTAYSCRDVEIFNLLRQQGTIHFTRNKGVPHWECKQSEEGLVIYAKLNGFSPMRAGDHLVDDDGKNYLVLSAKPNAGIGIAGNYEADLVEIVRVNGNWALVRNRRSASLTPA